MSRAKCIKKNLPTYGEAVMSVKFTKEYCLQNGELDFIVPDHKPRMDKEEATAYYTKKIKNYFDTIAYQNQKVG
jgi:hypothetical protein